MEDRRRRAADEARPHNDLAARKRQETAQWQDRLRQLKRARPRDEAAIAQAEERVKALSAEAREAAARAKEIEDAVYDLKAVNPHKKPVVDTRTPEQLLDIIEAKGREIAEALAVLRRR
jgi:type I restriction enzyme M protein